MLEERQAPATQDRQKKKTFLPPASQPVTPPQAPLRRASSRSAPALVPPAPASKPSASKEGSGQKSAGRSLRNAPGGGTEMGAPSVPRAGSDADLVWAPAPGHSGLWPAIVVTGNAHMALARERSPQADVKAGPTRRLLHYFHGESGAVAAALLVGLGEGWPHHADAPPRIASRLAAMDIARVALESPTTRAELMNELSRRATAAVAREANAAGCVEDSDDDAPAVVVVPLPDCRGRMPWARDSPGADLAIVCDSCGDPRGARWMLLCDGCSRAQHAQCLAPPLLSMPVGEQWLCPACGADADRARHYAVTPMTTTAAATVGRVRRLMPRSLRAVPLIAPPAPVITVMDPTPPQPKAASPKRIVAPAAVDTRPPWDAADPAAATALEAALQLAAVPLAPATAAHGAASIRRNKRRKLVLSPPRPAPVPPPQALMCRAELERRLADYCEPRLRGRSPGSLYVSGLPGTGKTLAMACLLRRASAEWGATALAVNCMAAGDGRAVMRSLLTGLGQPVAAVDAPLDAYGIPPEVGALRRAVCGADTPPVIFVLDELDALAARDPLLLASLFELPGAPGCRAVVVGVANTLDLAARVIPGLDAAGLPPPEHIIVPPYTPDELARLLAERLATLPWACPFAPQALELCAKKVAAAGSGDMRKALDVCRLAARFAHEDTVTAAAVVPVADADRGDPDATCPIAQPLPVLSPSPPSHGVRLRHVAAALAKCFSWPVVDTVRALPLHQQTVLCAAYLLLRRGAAGDSTTRLGELVVTYGDLCRQSGVPPIASSEVLAAVAVLADQALLALGSRVGRAGVRDDRSRRVSLKAQPDDVLFALQGVRYFRNMLE